MKGDCQEFHSNPRLVGEWTSRCFNDPQYADVKVSAPDGREFLCLRFILCSASDVFRCMLASEMVEGRGGPVRVQECDSDDMEQFLKFVHGCEIHINTQNLIPMWELANRFQVDCLKRVCQNYADNTLELDSSNCTRLLNSAVSCGMEDVVSISKSYIVDSIQEGQDVEKFIDLQFQAVVEIVEMGNSTLLGNEPSYFVLAAYVLDWMGCQSGSDSEELAESLGLKLSALGPYHLSCLCSRESVRRSSQLSLLIVAALGRQTELYKGGSGTSPVHVVTRSGSWEGWDVPASDWYYIAGSGAQGRGGFGTKGGLGAMVSGAFFLKKGDRLKVLIGNSCDGGGGCCVARVMKDCNECVLLLVAGGGGGGSEGSGKDASLEPEMWASINENENKADGNGCGFFFDGRPSVASSLLRGRCRLCDGGLFIDLVGGGGGGHEGGKGSVLGGLGGTSYLNPLAENPLKSVFTVHPHAAVWRGMSA
ncbi:hypothetical protein BSKO_13277 [Bryopsis sp. KO-2023]|nr:hypothetical protein BSKO_13277 [Bryopsis sp. KO-2023]